MLVQAEWWTVADVLATVANEDLTDEFVMMGISGTGFVKVEGLTRTWVVPRSFPCRLVEEEH